MTRFDDTTGVRSMAGSALIVLASFNRFGLQHTVTEPLKSTVYGITTHHVAIIEGCTKSSQTHVNTHKRYVARGLARGSLKYSSPNSLPAVFATKSGSRLEEDQTARSQAPCKAHIHHLHVHEDVRSNVMFFVTLAISQGCKSSRSIVIM